jgi:hypothetical protein
MIDPSFYGVIFELASDLNSKSAKICLYGSCDYAEAR